ncbi:cytochrome b5 domain-containing protein [Rhodoblastus acidophilus]|uniref:Cytochrome b5 domain-containing protein n=1 Tax=Candidatus Rhodoblastus alkanivorans TaxID=2954117 RepID=A0ABS9Z6R1_9HYPH|nr:cytochrome b5-like heme/steroid binding domain-containing protein [Candidatus Rhodoblastus alkanivorans]MCI4678661.1 cytochrome b5 domain-containing protein [Candidatus Rhodoblastus alkanivorans]MCI4683070.1 cytochrome b5 domain-containing protein [Candidatus Rhodoblastus alkanivorans]MDI4640381.1 cytochrome b5 domain-containing protein [Rhodoblastus acidophilus]
MRKIYMVSTATFWILVGGLWLAGIFAPKTLAETDASARKSFSLTEVATHASPGNCWMAIHGKVYDVTPYLPDHPSRPEVIEGWCGKEASKAYDTKTKGRRHSEAADRLLERYFIGDLKPTAP